MDSFHNVSKHGLTLDHNNGVYELSANSAIVKYDCKAHSLLSHTQTERKIDDITTSFSKYQFNEKYDNLYILSSGRLQQKDVQFLKEHRYKHQGELDLFENELTTSVCVGKEVLTIFSRVSTKDLFTSIKSEVKRKEHDPNTMSRHMVDMLLTEKENGERHVDKQGFTENQISILKLLKTNYHKFPFFYANIGTSIKWHNNGKRHPMAKMGSMTKIGLVTPQDGFYKVTCSGRFILRGIQPPPDCNKRGYITKWTDYVRNSVHPEIIRLIEVAHNMVYSS